MVLVSSSANYLVGLLGPLVLLGTGAGVAFPSLNALALAGVSPAQSGATAGLIQAMQQIGTSAGVAVLTVFLIASGHKTALLVAFSCSLVTLCIAVFGFRAHVSRLSGAAEEAGSAPSPSPRLALAER
jgi:hypothetical protein